MFGNKFMIEDATGAILAETGPAWHRSVTLDKGEAVRVRGEPGRDGTFDACVVTREDGETLEIRPAGGPPPWAGGSRRDRG